MTTFEILAVIFSSLAFISGIVLAFISVKVDIAKLQVKMITIEEKIDQLIEKDCS